MEQGYIILRDTSASEERLETFGPVRVARGTDAALVTEYGDKALYEQAKEDKSVVAAAPPMVIKLIKPVPKTGEPEEKTKQTGETWGVSVTKASSSPYTGKGIVVAVLDTGIDKDHEAFRGLELIQKDFTGEGNTDTDGHGTHCAGTIFGRVIDAYRFSMAPGIEKALIGKVIGSKGGTNQGIIEAIEWALEKGADVISMSLGIDFPGTVNYWQKRGYPAAVATSKALEGYTENVALFASLSGFLEQKTRARQKPFLLIAAAGNESLRDKNPDYTITASPPAAASGFISVGALGTTNANHDALEVANFSNAQPKLSAPGVDIYSAKAGGGYFKESGTSMATPHVAGIAALWLEKLREESAVTRLDWQSRLLGTATRSALKAGWKVEDVGGGLVQAPPD